MELRQCCLCTRVGYNKPLKWVCSHCRVEEVGKGLGVSVVLFCGAIALLWLFLRLKI